VTPTRTGVAIGVRVELKSAFATGVVFSEDQGKPLGQRPNGDRAEAITPALRLFAGERSWLHDYPQPACTPPKDM